MYKRKVPDAHALQITASSPTDELPEWLFTATGYIIGVINLCGTPQLTLETNGGMKVAIEEVDNS